MPTTCEHLADAICRLGYDVPLDDVTKDVWVRLAVLELVRDGEHGPPILTTRGKNVFKAIEQGNELISELEPGYAD